jgi:hypothetical protein
VKIYSLLNRWTLRVLLFSACLFFGQANNGELRLTVTDPSGLGVKASVQIVSEANQYRHTLQTTAEGSLIVQRLPYGLYRLEIKAAGFAALSEDVEVRSSIPLDRAIQLKLATVSESVEVKADVPLVEPDRAGAVNRIGTQTIEDRVGSIPGRSLQDLVNSQPGWLYEGSAVLHPRGSENQTQFVVDGVPLTDNRSPGLGPEIEADDVQSLSVYTAGIPAEYGRKMGGVVEVNTLKDPQSGFHGQVTLSGGSFNTGAAFGQGQYSWGQNSLGASASGSMTDRYLNPVVPQNFSNTGTLGDFSLNYQRDFTPSDRLNFIVRHEIARHDIPNEIVQEQAGQRQTGDNIETAGIVSYQHTFSTHVLVDFHGMVRDNGNDINSNPESTPIEVFQHNHFREGYFKAAVTDVEGRHEFKFGVESDNTFLNENFSFQITDPTQFDPGTPATFAFLAKRPDLEQSVFAQDLIHLGKWTFSAGARWDHYQLLVNRQALDPRLSASRFFPSLDLVVHVSYDRIFQTPSFTNILLSSSNAIESLNPANFLKFPVQPSQGNYYEAGFSKSFFGKVKLDGNMFRRDVNNFADDDQIQNTTVGFPIDFRKAILYGAEGKLEVPLWRHFSGFASYSYIVGQAFFPVAGGLFLGDNATAAATQLAGHFPGSQDQRNTVRGRLRYEATPRFWVAGGVQYDSGLPFAFNGDLAQARAEEGQDVLNRINFDRGRILPSFLVNASAGADIYRSERMKMKFQIDGENLSNVLNVIDFGGLFSGDSIGAPRSYSMRLTTTF